MHVVFWGLKTVTPIRDNVAKCDIYFRLKTLCT